MCKRAQALYRTQMHAAVDASLDDLEARISDAKGVPTLWQLTEAARTERRRLSSIIVEAWNAGVEAYLQQQLELPCAQAAYLDK